MGNKYRFSVDMSTLAALIALIATEWFKPEPPPVVIPVTPPPVVVPADPPATPPATPPVVTPSPSPPQPSPTPSPIIEPAMVVVYDADGKRIDNPEIEKLIGKLAVGTLRAEAIPKPGQVGWKHLVTVTDLGPGPTIPTPPVTPPPVVTPPVVTPPQPTIKATAAVYVYEKDDTAVPSAVLAALDKLNRERGIIATVFEDDTTDGDSQIPDQYKAPLAAAKEAGLPVLVVTAGNVVLKVVKNPKTAAEVLEAIAL